MTFELKPLHEQVIVITGASSGIGLEAARQAAQRGARLVLASRSDEALNKVVQEITGSGGEAIHVAADVGTREEVQRIADVAKEQFGGFDTWVNNAAVSIWGKLEEVSDEDHQRLFQTNFWGMVYGSLVALKTLKTRGGALINVGSLACDMAHPLQGMYTASKHALKGFTDSLRMELEQEGAPVSVTLIKPGSIDTPFPEHAKNYTTHEPHLPPPVYAPHEVATAILYAATHPKRDIYVGSSARTLSLLNRTAPRLADKIGSTFLYSEQLGDGPAPRREGALYQSSGGGRVRGGHRGYINRTSVYSRASRHPLVTGAVLAAAGAGLYALFTRGQPRGFDRTWREYEDELMPGEQPGTIAVAVVSESVESERPPE